MNSMSWAIFSTPKATPMEWSRPDPSRGHIRHGKTRYEVGEREVQVVVLGDLGVGIADVDTRDEGVDGVRGESEDDGRGPQTHVIQITGVGMAR